MRSRDPHEPHRSATPLELLYDLCFVVAIAQAATSLHHGLADGQIGASLDGYARVFFAIWWAWMNFAWFASAYDTDDIPYRLLVFVQMVGVLVLASGVTWAFEEHDFATMTAGYAIMRLGLVAQWLRAAHQDPERRTTALRYAIGVTLCQVGWIGMLFLPPSFPAETLGWAVLVPLEALVPVWAEKAGDTAWHPHHIAERYGLLTLIVLGEVVLAATLAIQSAIESHGANPELLQVIGAAPVIVFALWWLYFDPPAARILRPGPWAFAWGYGHFLIFGSAAAVGSGIQLAVDRAMGQSTLSDPSVGAALAIPVAVYVVAVWFFQVRPHDPTPQLTAAFLGAALCIVAGGFLPWSCLVAAAVLIVLVVLTETRGVALDPALSPS